MENDFLKPLNDYLKSYKTERENGEIFRVRRDENGKIIDKVRAYGNNNRPLDLLPAEEKPVSIWDVKRKIPFTTALADPDEAEYGLLTQTLEVPKERFFGLKKLDVKTGDIINSGMAEVFKFPSVKLLAGPKEVKETALKGEAQRTAAALKAGANWSMNALKNVFEGLVTIGDTAIEAFAKPAPEDYEFMPEKAKAVWESGLKLDAEKRNKETAFALKQFEDFAQSVIEKTGTNLKAGARPDEALVYEGTQAAMSLLGAIGVTVLAKNPSAGAAFFGAMQLGDTTSEGLKAGLSYQKAKAAGFTDAAWVSATELIGLKTYLSAIKANNLIANAAGRILAKTPKNLTARFAAVTAAGAFTEGAQEYIQDTGTDLIKNAYGVQNEKLGDILQKNIMSFVWGAVMGGGFGAAFNGASVLKTMGQVQSDLQKAGLPEEQARALAEQTAGEILSEDFVRDLTGPLIKEMSPMTYPDFDKNKVAQNLEAAIAGQKDRAKQLIDISAGYEEALRKNGTKEEEAQAAGRILANIVDNIAKKNKVLPKTAESFLNFKIERQAEDLPPAAQESYAQNGVEESNKNKTVDLTPAFEHIQNLTKENALQIVEEELNALIGKPLDTATPPLQIQITSENKYHIISSNVQLKGNQKKRHQSSLLVLEKIINNAVKTQRKGEVDLRHNTRPQTLRHKSNVEEYIYFSAPLKIRTDKGEVYFTAELASERVKGQSPDLLDLYNIRIKRAPAAAFKNTLQTEGSKNESQPINTSDVNSITNEAEDFNSYTPQEEKTSFDLIPSVYGRNNFTAFVKNNIENGNLLYLDEKRAAEFVRPQELQSPKGNKADGFFNNIPTKEDVVKRYGQGRRGSIDLSKKENVYYALVKIMQTGDKSTLLHELGHLWLYTAQDIYAEDEFKETKKDLDEWLGKPQVKDGRYVYTRAQQEKLAQGLETYLMEGKPPAPALKSVFEKIRQWFMDIYNGALVEMSEAGRAVYDRMFELSGGEIEEHLKLYQDEVKTKKTRKAIKQLREEGKTDVEGLTLKDIEEYLSVLDMGAPPLPKATLRTYLRKYGANYAGAGRVDAEAYKNARIPNRKEGIGDDLARRLIDWGFLAGEIDTYEDLNRLNQEAAEMIERALNGEDVYRLEDLPAVEQFEVYMEAAKTAEDALGGKMEEYRRVKDIIKGLRLEGYRPVSAKDIDFVAAQIEELEASAREEAEDALNPKIEKARKEAEAWKNTADKRQEDLHKAKAAARAEFEEKLKAFTESEMPDAENYKNPSKDCVLPPLNTADLKLLNKKSKPVVLKKNIIEKEKKRHPEIPTEEYNEILAKALYGATAILQVKPKTKPNYFTFLRENEKGQSAVLEMAENKDNFEVVSFLKIDKRNADKYKKITRREDGQFLITERSEPQGAAVLSALASDNKSITEKEREVNQRARAVKKAVISEINKREIENKEALLKELKEAKEAKDILDAAGILLEKLEAEYAKTEEGKAERRKLDAPATDWGAKKAGVLKEINALMQSAEEKTRQAQAVLEEESRAKLGYRGPLTEEEKSAANRAKAFLKENFTPRLTAVLQKALSGEEHLSPADVNRMIAHTAGTVSHFKKSLNQQINGLMAWAEKTQKENYNRYIWRKIDTELKRKAFEKSGNVKKAKLSQRAFDFLQKAREYWGLKKPEFTLENFKKPLRAEDITEIHNQVTGEVIPLIDHIKGRENEKVKPIEIREQRTWTNTKEDEKILSNIVFKDGKALVLENKNGKKYSLSKSSLGKMYNTSFGRNNETFALKKNIIADIENIFPQMEPVISHKEAKYNIDRNIERFAAVVKDKNGNLFNVMAVSKNGKVAEVVINNLYDLQIEGKEIAEGPSGAHPGHLPHINNLGDLRDFVKRKIAKYNKNYAGQKVIPARDTAFKPLLNGDNDIIAEKSNTFNLRTKPYSPEELQVILNARQDKAMAAVQNGDIYPVEEALLNGVLEFLVNGKENNPADSQKLFEDVSALLKAGRANKLREKLRKQLSREYLREALNQALRNRKLPFGAKWFLNLPDTNYKQFLLNAFGVIEHEEVNENGELVKTKTNLADALDTLKGQRGTALYKYEKGRQLNDIFRNVLNLKSNGAVLNKIAELQKTVFTAENYMRALNEADGAEQARILQDGKWLAEQDIDQDDLNKLEIMSVYEWYKNTQPETREDGSIVDYGLRGRLLRQYGQAQLDQMFALLSEPEKRLADVLQKFVASQWARENAVFREMHGFSLPQDPNYLPSVARRMDIGGDTDYIKQYISASANPSFIKKRVKSFRVAMKPTSILEIVQNHTNRAAEYINEALTFNLIKGVFKSEKIERAFESAAGREDGKKLYDKLLRLIDLQGPQIKKSAGSSPVMEFIFNGWVKSAMALKATVGAKQFATGISFAEKMPFHIWAKYFLEGMAKPKATYDFMLKNVPHIEVRFAQGSINESLQRAMAARDLNLLQTRWNNLTNALMFNIRWGDKASFVYGGYPYYKYLTEDLKLSPQEARAKVEEQGESTLQSSQKALLGEYQANADNYAARIYTVFRNQSKQYFGKLATSYIQYKNGEISAADFGKTWLLYAALNPMIYTLLGFAWLYPGKDDDGEEKAQKGVFDVLASPITGLASVNAFAEAGVKYLLDAVYAKSKNQKLPAPGSVAMPAFEDIQRDVNKAVKAYNDAGGLEELLGEMSLTDSINSLAALLKYTGLPAQTALNAAGGVKDVFDGKTAKGLLRAAGYTEYRAGQMTGEKKKKTKKRRKKQRRNN